jgi:hypothetical protein
VDDGVAKVMQAFDMLVSWLATQPNGAVLRRDLDMVEAALSGRFEGEQVHVADAALRLALLAASFGTAEMYWLAWALAALAEDWLRPEREA